MPAIVFAALRRPRTLRDAQWNLDGAWLVPFAWRVVGDLGPARWAYEADLRRVLTHYEGHDAREFYDHVQFRWRSNARRPWLVEYTQAELDEVLAELVLQDLAEVV